MRRRELTATGGVPAAAGSGCGGERNDACGAIGVRWRKSGAAGWQARHEVSSQKDVRQAPARQDTEHDHGATAGRAASAYTRDGILDTVRRAVAAMARRAAGDRARAWRRAGGSRGSRVAVR